MVSRIRVLALAMGAGVSIALAGGAEGRAGGEIYRQREITAHATALNACDLNQDGGVNVLDLQLAVDMLNGVRPCTADIDGPDVCNMYVVNAVLTTTLGGVCTVVSGNPHTASLSWTASISPNIAHYNIYRTNPTVSDPSPTTFTLLGSSTKTSYSDNTVGAGFTYQYYATAVDSSGKESSPSNTVPAVVPFP